MRPDSYDTRTHTRWSTCIALVAVAIRLHLIAQPLDRDEGLYAYVAQQLLDGHVPYRDTFSDKPPASYLIYALFISVMGPTTEGIHLGGALWVAGTSLWMAGLARRLYGTIAGIAAGMLYAITCAESSYQGSSINLELLLTPFAVAALRLILAERLSVRIIGLSGALLGVAVLTKQQAVGHSAFAAAWLLARWLCDPTRKLSQLLARQSLLIASALAIVAGSMAVFVWFGSLGDYLDGILLWNLRTYVPHETAAAAWPNFYTNALKIFLRNPLFAAAAAAGMIGSLRQNIPNRWFAPLWLLANLPVMCIGWRFYSHYFLLLQPALVLAAAWAIGRAVEWSLDRTRSIQAAVLTAAALVIASPVLIQWDYFFRWSPRDHVRELYDGPEIFAESARLAEFVARNSSPTETVFIYGSEPQIYFLAHRRCASRYVFAPPLTARGPDTIARQRQAIAQLKQNPPRLILALGVPMSLMTEPGTPPFFWDELLRITHHSYRIVLAMQMREQEAQYEFGSVTHPLELSDDTPEVIVMKRRI